MNSQTQFSITSKLSQKGNSFLKTGLSTARSFLILAAFAISEAHSSAQFPAIGADSGPGIIITVTANNASISFTGQGPYDSIDDTYVGVINNSSRPVFAMQIRSALDIFGFDGDGIFGIDSTTGLPFNPKPPGGPYGPTGYEGPGVSFSGISADQTSGTVNFNPPIPVGGTAYFSLEESITAVCSAADVLNNSVKSVANQTANGNIDATFTPQCGGTGGNPPTLQQAAALCGFVNFDWIQIKTHINDPTFFSALNINGAFDPTINGPVKLSSSRTPYNDPPQGGGYTYNSADPDFSYPFYYNAATSELTDHEPGGLTLTFHDAPSEPCLPGGSAVNTAACNNTSEPAGSFEGFTTHLAGVNSDGTATDLGIGFSYTSTYTGTAGNVHVNKTDLIADGNGTGGITVTATNNTTTYQYNGIVVTTINGVTAGLDREISLSGNLAFGGVPINSSVTNTMTVSNSGTDNLTITNIVFPSGYAGEWSTNPIPPGETESVMVTFSPTAAILYFGVVTVESDATSGDGAIAISGYGASGTLVLVVLTNGNGRVSPNLNGKTLVAGTRHTLTAIPSNGYVFSNWIGSTVTNKNPLTFTMEKSTVLQANFVPNPFLPVKGIYNGLFFATNGVTEATAGMLKGLVLAQNGTYSGTLLNDGATYGLSGTFSLGGEATNVIKRLVSQGGPLLVEMSLVTSSNSAPQILGTVTGTNNLIPWTANLMANFATNALPSREYTVLMLPDTNNAQPTLSPGGDGYLLITNYAGTARNPASATTRITGALADGTPFNQAVPVSQAGFVPIYASLYAGKGLLLGWINIVLTNNGSGVELTWIHPARASGLYPHGFTNMLSPDQILLSEWTNSPFAEPNITSIADLSFLDSANTVTNIAVKINDKGTVSGTAVTGAINPKTGFLSVTVGKGAAKISATGAILLNATNGGGFFLTKTNSLGIELDP